MSKSYPNGGKITSSHGSLIEAAEIVVKTAQRDPHTSKIALSVIDARARTRQRRLKFMPTDSGWKLTIYSLRGLQEIYLYTDHAEATRIRIAEAFLQEHPDALIS